MLTKTRTRAFPLATILVLGASAMLVACSNSQEYAESVEVFESEENFFAAVDERLNCRNGSSSEYYFSLPDEERALEGRTCDESIVMAWTNNSGLLSEVRDMMDTAEGKLYLAEGPTWFVADISDVSPGLSKPRAAELEALAQEWDALYVEE